MTPHAPVGAPTWDHTMGRAFFAAVTRSFGFSFSGAWTVVDVQMAMSKAALSYALLRGLVDEEVLTHAGRVRLTKEGMVELAIWGIARSPVSLVTMRRDFEGMREAATHIATKLNAVFFAASLSAGEDE